MTRDPPVMTKTLILMRHAKSSWKDATLDDIDRPLNKRGRQDAPAMGDRLAGLGVKPDLVVTSPARRAQATARIVAPRVGYPLSAIVIEPAIYEAHPRVLLDVVRALDDAHDVVMLFGHNPGFTQLAETLTGAAIGNLPTAGVAIVTSAAPSWKSFAPGFADLSLVDYPKNPDY